MMPATLFPSLGRSRRGALNVALITLLSPPAAIACMLWLGDLTGNLGVAFAVPVAVVYVLYFRTLRRACPPSSTLWTARLFSAAVALVLMPFWLLIGWFMFVAFGEIWAGIHAGDSWGGK